ncbi:SLATT domain-containing protein [Planococcus shenhongbingii]|uniref:SLATT domain-containing protein n=1 Tax=Planococcus shenhongbingii TaxID=3058398 RepID=UPI002621F496|nr:SLATT domain-containing protein [Planococcus sp. N016]WKA60323.1 SLATT domain-containing protein [Planococcus sp. N016]
MEETTKDLLLKEIANYGYRAGFGAKKHFATYDMSQNIPITIAVIGILAGIGQVAYPDNNFSTGLAILLIMASIIGLIMNPFNEKKENYDKVGSELTEIFNELQNLFYEVKVSPEETYTEQREKLKSLVKEFNSTGLSHQMFGSDWYAHYKFFFQMEKQWIEEVRPFKLWGDKIPASLLIFSVVVFLLPLAWNYLFSSGGII